MTAICILNLGIIKNCRPKSAEKYTQSAQLSCSMMLSHGKVETEKRPKNGYFNHLFHI